MTALAHAPVAGAPDAQPDRRTGYHRKIVRFHEIAPRLGDVIGAGPGRRDRAVVHCHGCFDIVHPGHIRYLQFAREQGDVLVVSITGDAAIDKGDQRPYIPEELRAENLAALELVDHVIIDPHPTAREVLSAIRPDIYVKGHEYAASRDARFLAERQVVESAGGRVMFSSGQVIFSSSRLIETLAKSESLEADRLATVCRRHRIDGDSIGAILRAVAGKRFLVIGDVLIERYVVCDGGNVTSESPMMSLTAIRARDYLGGSSIIARQLAALGARPVLFTALGDDRRARRVARQLDQWGVELRAIRRRERMPVRTRFLVDDHKLFRVDRAAVRPLDSVDERDLAEVLGDEAPRHDAAIFYDAGFGLLTAGLYARVAPVLRSGGALLAGTATEPGGQIRALRDVDLLLTSERRLRAATHDLEGGLSSLAYDMMRQTQARRMIVTVAKRGLVTFNRPSDDPRSAAWNDRLQSEYLPSLADRVLDRLGAGEAMLAAAVAAMTCGANMMQAAYLASATAAIVLRHMGIHHVACEELVRWLHHRPELGLPDPSPVAEGASPHGARTPR